MLADKFVEVDWPVGYISPVGAIFSAIVGQARRYGDPSACEENCLVVAAKVGTLKDRRGRRR